MTTETQATDPARIAVPYGMALVPLQATFEMVSAFHEVTDDDQLAYGNAQSRWRAMLASAPVVAPLTLETAEEARADRAHAESYFRQAEKLLTANEQTLRAERDQLLEQLAAAQREVVELRAAIPAPEGAQAARSHSYLAGHADGLEWAACLVAQDDPRTGDWMHDDRSDLAAAIRKGPEMPDAEPLCEDQATWCGYVAGMVGAYLNIDSEDDRIPVMAKVIERRLWALPRLTASTPAPAEGDDMLEPLIYAAIMHNGTPKTVAEFERASAAVADMLKRRAAPAGAAPYCMWCEKDGHAHGECWARHGLPHPGSPEASAMIDSELAAHNWPTNTKNAARAGYVACMKLIASNPQPKDIEPSRAKQVTEIMLLVGQYWDAAFVEGKEGRSHDTEDGRAQVTLTAIYDAVKRLAASQAPAPAHETTVSEFTNELGNAIRITIEGPTSTSENVLTPMEAAKLRGALNEHAAQAPAVKAERPTKPGWYVVLPPDFDEPKVRAFGKDGQWWIPLGKGNGDDGWMTGREYQNWVGPIADIDDRQPFLAEVSAPAVIKSQGLDELYEELEPALEQLVSTCNNHDSTSCWEEVIAAEAVLERLYKARVSAVSNVPVQTGEQS